MNSKKINESNNETSDTEPKTTQNSTANQASPKVDATTINETASSDPINIVPGNKKESRNLSKQKQKLDSKEQSTDAAEITQHQPRSASRDSSLNIDDPKSIGDSISAASGKQNWSLGKDLADGDEPSISSLKGDSISATIAYYNKRNRGFKQQQNNQSNDDHQSRSSNQRLVVDESRTADDISSNINFYAAGSSSSTAGQNSGMITKPGDFVSVSSAPLADAFDIIEESSNISSYEELGQLTSTNVHARHRNRAEKASKKTYKKNHQHNSRHHRHNQHPSQWRQTVPYLEQPLDADDLPQGIYQIEPIILRGNGNLTLFGLSNSFSAEFPSSLIGRVSREEFDKTMKRINSLLKDQQSLSAKLLLFGGLCCCCSLGFSLIWPSIILKKRSKSSLEKFLANENNRLYSKLGLNWKLGEQRCYSNHAFVEYVLMIEFTPKVNLYLPD